MRRTIAAALAATLVSVLAATTSRAATPAFGTPVRVPGGNQITEPGVNVSSNGTIYVDGPAGTPGRSRLWRSTDGGASFNSLSFGTTARLPGGGDSDVATRGNRVYFLDLWAGSNSLNVSEDGGSTWTFGSPYSTLPLSDRQWITLGDPDPTTGMDTVYILYALIQSPRQVMIARSRTGGITWEYNAPVPALNSASGFTGQIVSDGHKFLAFAWEDGGVLRVATSADEGETWTVSDDIADDVWATIQGVTLDGNDIYVTWTQRGDNTTRVAISRDKGLTFGDDIIVSNAGTTNAFPWIDARDGKVAVAWYGADAVASRPDNVPLTTLWNLRYVESTDGGETFTAPVSIDVAKTGIICTQGLGCDPTLGGPDGRELGDFLTVTINNEGRSLIVYGGSTGKGVRLVKQF